MKTTIKVFIFLVIGFFSFGFSQKGEVNNLIFEGNEQFQKEAYVKAEKAFRKALSLSPKKSDALYNLGNTHFLDKQFNEASQRFFQTQKFAANKDGKHKAFHNMGNVFMQQKEYQKAVESYKNALRNNPSDEETRYNFALAKELLEKEKPPEEQEQEDNKNKEEKDQDKEQDKDQKGDQEDKEKQDPKKEGEEEDETKDKGEPKNEGDQKKDEKPNESENKPENEKQSPKKGQLSPQQVKSLLEAMNNQEKKVQEKINAKKTKGIPVRGKKDW
mgnify:CR=1 FL=1